MDVNLSTLTIPLVALSILATPVAQASPGDASDNASSGARKAFCKYVIEERGNAIDCDVALDFADSYCHQRDRGYSPEVSRTIVRQVSTSVGYHYHLTDDVATAAILICTRYSE